VSTEPVALGGPQPARPEDRWRLGDERDFLIRSLADAESEHAAGDLSERDYRALVRRDEGRLAEVTAALAAVDAAEAGPEMSPSRPDAAEPTGPAPSGRRRRRGWLAVGGAVAVAAAAVLLVTQLASPRLAGQPPSGSVTLNAAQRVRQQLGQAEDLVAHNDLGGALGIFQKVLAEDPRQPEALAEAGWIEYQAGTAGAQPALVSDGEASVRTAVSVDPAAPSGHLYLGIIALRHDHDPTAAADQFARFLADHPTSAQVASAAVFIRQADEEAGRPVPAAAAAG